MAKIPEELLWWAPKVGYVSVQHPILDKDGKYKKILAIYCDDQGEPWDMEVIDGEGECQEFINALCPNEMGGVYETMRQLLSDIEEGKRPRTRGEFIHEVRIRLGIR